ncbi:MAG: fluoride efflux transporter CrcB [Bacteroidia bacterium]|nr:fluoride efflux transporter CrcB [Bacteroidia bacterium]
MIKSFFFIFIGGGLGSVLRFSLGKWISSLHTYYFPFGTLIVNILACFILGLVIGLADHKQLFSPDTRLFWTVGFCGGFSTFSTFSNETLDLLQGGFTLNTFFYVTLSLLLCLAATFGGLYAGEHI